MFEFLKVGRAKSIELLQDTMDFMSEKYNQSKDLFNYSSAYGQIILVVQNLQQIVLFYIQDSITQLNYKTANRKHTLYGNARMSGHNPMRGSAALGEISLSLIPEGLNKIVGSTVYLINHTRLQNDITGLEYVLDIKSDFLTMDLRDLDRNFLVLEGKMENQRFTGRGQSLQSFNVNVPSSAMVDDQKVIVSVNDEQYTIYDSIYEIPFDRKGCIIKTSYSNGIDIFFGEKNVHKIPEMGDEIRIDYLVHNGIYGNSEGLVGNSFKFVDGGMDEQGNDISLNDIFEIKIEKEFTFGANSEDPEKTKLLSSFVPKNNIIHDEASILYYFDRMNIFDDIKIKNMNQGNRFDCILYPQISYRITPIEDYFSMDIQKLLLSEVQKNRLINGLMESGRLSTNIDIRLANPTLKKFVIFLMLDVKKEVNGSMIKEIDVYKSVRKTLSNYMISNKRKNIIPHSDIVRELDELDMIDKVKVIFKTENSNMLDAMGNVSLNPNEMAVMRGNINIEGDFFEDNFSFGSSSLSTVNLDMKFI